MRQKSYYTAIAFVLLQSLLYGFGDPISKAAYQKVPVYSLLTARYWISFFFLMLVCGKKVIRELRSCNIRHLILPSVCIASAYLLSNMALGLTTATSVAFVRSTSTIMTPLLAFVVFHKPYSKKHVPILVCVIIGLYLLCNPGGDLSFGWGEVLTLISALMIAGSLVFAESAMQNVDALTVTTVQVAVTAILTTICALAGGAGIDLKAADLPVWMTILYLALTCTVGGYLLQNFALTKVQAGTVSLVQCMHPVMTSFFSFFILHERLGIKGMIGAGLIIVCVAAENILTE